MIWSVDQDDSSYSALSGLYPDIDINNPSLVESGNQCQVTGEFDACAFLAFIYLHQDVGNNAHPDMTPSLHSLKFQIRLDHVQRTTLHDYAVQRVTNHKIAPGAEVEERVVMRSVMSAKSCWL